MKNLKVLSIEELKSIQGGDWIYDAGKNAHKIWCSFKSGVSKGYNNYISSISDTPAMG